MPTEMDLLGRGCSSEALLMESAVGLQRAAAEPGDTGPLDLKQGPQMADHLSGGQLSFLMMPEGSPFLPYPLSSLFPSYPSPLISRSPILGSLAAGWLHKAAWPSRAGRGGLPLHAGPAGSSLRLFSCGGWVHSLSVIWPLLLLLSHFSCVRLYATP